MNLHATAIQTWARRFEPEDVESLGAGSRAEGVLAFTESALDLIQVRGIGR